jgi:hypothetical protein
MRAAGGEVSEWLANSRFAMFASQKFHYNTSLTFLSIGNLYKILY